MNQRIKELAIETDAWCDLNVIGDPKYNIIWEEKFAELIVKECAKVNYNSPFKDGEFHARELLEHFGIEE